MESAEGMDAVSTMDLWCMRESGMCHIGEAQNAHGFGSFVWRALSVKYGKGDEHYGMGREMPDNVKSESWPLSPAEWNVFWMSWFVNSFVPAAHVATVAQSLETFAQEHPAGEYVCHLRWMAERMRSPEAVGSAGIGWSFSIMENAWFRYDDAEDESRPVLLGDGRHWTVPVRALESITAPEVQP